jgi:AcrR family transcriptional regulator
MPRALTEQEKCKQCEKLLEKGKEVIFKHGIKKVSVEEITKAAGMAKGTFYHHFDTKEKFFYAFIKLIHKQVFDKAEKMIRDGFTSGKDLHVSAMNFVKNLFFMPEMSFFIKNERDIDELFFGFMQNEDMYTFKQMEVELFEKMLKLAGADTGRVKPGVVHNYIHTLYLVMSSDLMTEDDLPETVELITGSLVNYVFGGTRT